MRSCLRAIDRPFHGVGNVGLAARRRDRDIVQISGRFVLRDEYIKALAAGQVILEESWRSTGWLGGVPESGTDRPQFFAGFIDVQSSHVCQLVLARLYQVVQFS